MTEDWKHKDVWKRSGKNFLLEISRHSVLADFDEGPHRWAVYAYIYPKHARFSKFDGPDMWQEATLNLPMHRGPSLLHWHYDEAMKPTSVQVGADYNHLHDDRFTHYANPEEAYEVFSDAENLFKHLNRTDDEDTPATEPPGLREEFEASQHRLPDAREIGYWERLEE